MSDEDEPKYLIKVNKTAVRVLLNAVNKHLEIWPGGDAQEQTNLQSMKHYLTAVALEFQFDE